MHILCKNVKNLHLSYPRELCNLRFFQAPLEIWGRCMSQTESFLMLYTMELRISASIFNFYLKTNIS